MACTCPFFRLRRPRRLVKLLGILLICFSISYFFFILITQIDITVKTGGKIFIELRKHSNLTVSVWRNVCNEEVIALKKSPFYPRYPEEKTLVRVSGFFVEDNSREYGQTITGFLHSHENGIFRFAIASDDSSELWLSSSEDPKGKRLIARVFSSNTTAWTKKDELKKYSTQISNYVYLHNGSRYYIEVIHKQGSGAGFVQVFWEGPGDSGFKLISAEFISPYFDNIKAISTKEALRKLRNTRLANSEAARQKYLYFHSLPYVGERNYLPPCTYKSSLMVSERIKVGKYNGRELVHLSNVFPEDDTFMGKNKTVWSWPNRVADAEIVHWVLDKLIAALSMKTSKKYFLKDIVEVLQKPDPVYGDRFLVELEVGLHDTNQSFRLSEHVYQKKGSAELCHPEGIRWNNNATVYFIVPVKNQGKWVHHLISDLSFASSMTGDTNFHVIVVDFQSEDINMTEAFQTPILKNRHTIVNLTGKFFKTLALNEGVNKVPGAQDILFLFDLHIDVPYRILDTVRKNTIEGRVAYFPIAGRLECGSSSEEHVGHWEMEGYGLLSIYKSDWDRFGGMNTEEYKYKWGGEDWDLLDRVMNARLEVERSKVPGLYHHFHSKDGMWS